VRKCILCLFLLTVFLSILSIEFEKKLHFTNYTLEDGLPNNEIHDIYQDKNFNIWFATSYGVSRFDGKYFENFSKEDGLVGSYVKSIAETQKGEIIFGTSNGLSIFNGFEFKNITKEDGLISNTIFAVETDKENNIWILSSNALSKYDGKQIENFSGIIDNGYGRGEIFFSESGNIIIGTNGIYSFKNKKFEILLSETKNQILWSILLDKKGNLWFEIDGKIHQYDGKETFIFGEKEGIKLSTIYCFFEDSNGYIWFGTDFGVLCYNWNGLLPYQIVA